MVYPHGTPGALRHLLRLPAAEAGHLPRLHGAAPLKAASAGSASLRLGAPFFGWHCTCESEPVGNLFLGTLGLLEGSPFFEGYPAIRFLSLF